MRLDLTRRSDRDLLREFNALVGQDRHGTAEMLAYIGEIQARRLHVPAGYSSMYRYCVQEMHMSEDVAFKRTQVARLARRFPIILELIADGRLHLTAVVKLLPHRNARDFAQLLLAAAHKTKPEIERLLAERFPRPDAPTVVRPLGLSAPSQELVPEPVVQTQERGRAPESAGPDSANVPALPVSDVPAVLGWSGSPVEPPAPAPMEAPAPRARVEPLAPERFVIQVTVGQVTHDKLRRAQELLGHWVSPGDIEQVLDRALDALIRQLEHARFAATENPRRAPPRSTAGKRHVPAEVKRIVHARDGGRCTFVSESGHRCEERRDLEYDHVDPFARGGEATVAKVRLLCRPHNQLAAERVYGAGFMARKREQAKLQRRSRPAGVGLPPRTAKACRDDSNPSRSPRPGESGSTGSVRFRT